MSEQHDTFCTLYELGFCECDDIAAIRADEREKAGKRVYDKLVQHGWTPNTFQMLIDAARSDDN